MHLTILFSLVLMASGLPASAAHGCPAVSLRAGTVSAGTVRVSAHAGCPAVVVPGASPVEAAACSGRLVVVEHGAAVVSVQAIHTARTANRRRRGGALSRLLQGRGSRTLTIQRSVNR